jgi:signal transduction histidine kinase
MKPDKHFVAAAAVLIATACLIVLTWVSTNQAIYAQRLDTTNRATATLTNQSLVLSEQINRQILGIDQTLRTLVTAWQANPRGFDLEALRSQAVVLNGLSRDMVLTDENGIIRQSSVVEAINQNASALDYFRALSDPSDPGDRLYIGPAAIDGIMRQWHMNVARALHHPDGSFAGVIDADYRISAITDVFAQTDLGPNDFIALAGLEDGKLRGAVSSSTIDPDANVIETPMFAAIKDNDSGTWTGPSATDAVPRIHAYRHIPDRKLAVIVAMSEAEALRPATVFREEAQLFAGCITALLAGLGLVLIQGTRLARRRAAGMAEDRAQIAASNAQLEVARALAAAKAEQLEATLAGMNDGVAMVDAHMCLIEWNARFPDLAGVPPGILRVGLPMEEILRAQIETGQFGRVPDPEAEIERRMTHLRTAPFGVVRRQRPDGHALELRRNRLPDGGFLTVFSDVTEHRLAEEALRQAREAAEVAKVEKSRFAAIVSHEIRTPLNALLHTIRQLSDSVLSPAQQSLLVIARQSGDVLFGLISDILDMSKMEAGKLTIRHSLFDLRPMLDSCVEMLTAQAAERGIALQVAVAEGTATTLLTDPSRLRQVLLNLLSNATKYARPGEVWLIAEPDGQEGIRLTVRDDGPVVAAEARTLLFKPFSRLGRPGGEDPAGTGLGLSICRDLVTLMGGQIGYDAWHPGDPATADTPDGNAFWVTLPPAALPYRTAGDTPTPAQPLAADRLAPPTELPQRALPRTRILLAEDVVANQLVTATLLRREGHHVDVAANGPAAIEAMRSTPYDLAFIDMIMPGMEGPEATRIIRALPQPAGATPIIALTADISPGDDAAFKVAGMDGAIGKPVSLAELLDVIRVHVWAPLPRANQPGTLDEAGASDLSGPPVLVTGRLNDLRAAMSPVRFAELIEECLIDLDHQLPALRRALIAGAPGAIAAHARAMVGVAGTYGMAALESRLRSVMDAARDGEIASLDPTIIADLERDLTQTATRLRDMLRTEIA